MADNKDIDTFQLIEKFRMQVADKAESSRRNYQKAISALESFLGSYPGSGEFPSETSITDWYVYMCAQGLTPKTALHYFDIIAALCNATIDGFDGAFASVRLRIKALEKTADKTEIDAETFKRVQSMLNAAASQKGTTALATDMLMYSLLHLAMPIVKVAKVKTADICDSSDEIADLVKRQSSPKRKYLFDLNQSRLTDKQLRMHVETLLANLFTLRNIKPIGSVDNTIRAIWAYAALRCGISGSEIVSVLATAPQGIQSLSLCAKAKIEPDEIEGIQETVAPMFVHNPWQWYAMKLRPRVDYDTLADRIERLDQNIVRPELYYPYEEITKRIGKKLVHDKQPVIRDVVFFRLRLSDIFPLFGQIGDIAWCYTKTGKPGGDYAVVPAQSLYRFQQAIGTFTPQYEIAPIGGFPAAKGETIVVLTGLMANHQFDLKKIEPHPNTIYQLHLIGPNGIQWRTTATPQ